MRHYQVEAPATGCIGGIRAHAGFELAVDAHGYSRRISDLAKSAVAIVAEQEVRHGVVGDENVLPAVVIVIEGDYAEAVARFLPESGAVASVGESAIAVVMVQGWRLAMINVRMAITPQSGTFAAAVEIVFRRPVDVVGNHQVQFAVVVVIEPRGAGTPLADVSYSGLRCHVGKCAIPVVVIEDASSVAEHEEVRESVVVVVADRDAHTKQAFSTNPGAFRNIAKGAVAVVLIQGAPQWPPRGIQARGGPIRKIDIRQTILVVIDPPTTRTHRFNQILFNRSRIVMNKRKARRTCDIGESNQGRAWDARETAGAGRQAYAKIFQKFSSGDGRWHFQPGAHKQRALGQE